MKEITNEQIAYLAGFLEGEGSFCITRPHNSYRPLVRVGQKTPKVLIFLQETSGVGKIRRTIRFRKGKYSAFYSWDVEKREDLVDLISKIYPYLVSTRTKRRAWCVLRSAKIRGNFKGSRPRISRENLSERGRLYEIWSTTRR